MPIYEFRCASCGHQFEELIFRTSEVDELVCPKCGATQVSRQMSTFAAGGASRGSGGGSGGGGSGGCGPGSFT